VAKDALDRFRHALFLGVTERPDSVALNPLARQLADRATVPNLRFHRLLGRLGRIVVDSPRDNIHEAFQQGSICLNAKHLARCMGKERITPQHCATIRPHVHIDGINPQRRQRVVRHLRGGLE
jgi:hypothetical protein